jgi:hypothetical protein
MSLNTGPDPSLDLRTAENGRSENHTPAAESRILISAEGEPSYHGPTSTLFDEGAAGDRRIPQNVSTIPKLSPVWVQKGLMAEAAYQRGFP